MISDMKTMTPESKLVRADTSPEHRDRSVLQGQAKGQVPRVALFSHVSNSRGRGSDLSRWALRPVPWCDLEAKSAAALLVYRQR